MQYRSHIFEECLGHLIVDSRPLKGSTSCSFDKSDKCSPLQASHRYSAHISQCKDGWGYHKDDTVTHPGHNVADPWSKGIFIEKAI